MAKTYVAFIMNNELGQGPLKNILTDFWKISYW